MIFKFRRRSVHVAHSERQWAQRMCRLAFDGRAVVSLSLVLLAGCSGKSTTPVAPIVPATTSVPDTLRSLQTSGVLPVLDTTATIVGTDANSNGVRDDLDTFIAAQPDSSVQRKALTQFAQAIQTMMTVDLGNPSAVSAASLANNRAVTCIWQSYTTNQHKKVVLMEELSVNTLIRLKAYEKYNAARNGAAIPSLSGPTCN